jgi:hypothetical protein
MVAAGLDGASLSFLTNLDATGRLSKKEDPLSPILNAIKKGRDGGPSQAAQVRFADGVSLPSRSVLIR